VSIQESADHRRASEAELLAAVGGRDPLALAEAYHRVGAAAYASARRLVGSATEAEAVLRGVFGTLWDRPPSDVPLEGWARAHAHALGVERLMAASRPAASPSAAELVPELGPAQSRRPDVVEQALIGLEERDRRALVLAHDHGVPAHRQGHGAGRALVRALTVLAGPDPRGDEDAGCDDQEGLGDWVLGLLPAGDAEAVHARVAARSGCADLVRTLRRGRRRLEGLPPTADAGQRILVAVVAGLPVPAPRTAGSRPGPVAVAPRSARPPTAEPRPAPAAHAPAPATHAPAPATRAPAPATDVADRAGADVADPADTGADGPAAADETAQWAPPAVVDVAPDEDVTVGVVRTTRRARRADVETPAARDPGPSEPPSADDRTAADDVVPSAARRAAAAPAEERAVVPPATGEGAATDGVDAPPRVVPSEPRTRELLLDDDRGGDREGDAAWAPPGPLAQANRRTGGATAAPGPVLPAATSDPDTAEPPARGSTRTPVYDDDGDDDSERDGSSVRSTVLTIVIALLSIGVGFVVVSALLSAL